MENDKLYCVYLQKSGKYDIFNEWKYANLFIEENKKDKPLVVSYWNDGKAYEKIQKFLAYVMQGNDRILKGYFNKVEDRLNCVYLIVDLIDDYSNNIHIGYYSVRKLDEEYLTHKKMIIPQNIALLEKAGMTLEQQLIIEGMRYITQEFERGTQIVVLCNSKYLEACDLDVYKANSKQMKVFKSEFDKYTCGYTVQVEVKTRFSKDDNLPVGMALDILRSKLKLELKAARLRWSK